MNRLITLALAGSALVIAGTAAAQPVAVPTPPAVAVNPLISTHPTYVTIVLEKMVNGPAAQVWARVGKFCDIGEWMQRECHVVSGTGEVGTIRSVSDEVLVAKTALSYTYAQTLAFATSGANAGRPYNLYHGTLEARPMGARTTKLIYTLFYDNSMVPGGEAGRAAEIEARRKRFEGALANMKLLAEGGKVPPAPPAALATPAPVAR